MQLHIISKSPFSHQAFNDALALIHASDSVILIDDGVYAANGEHAFSASIKNHPASWYILKADTETRGLKNLIDISQINMTDFVELSFKAKNTISWF